MPKLVYLCGPITGCDNLNAEQFGYWQDRLMRLGYTVLNPHDLFQDVDTKHFKWEDYMKHCIAQMVFCNIVATLPDWHESKGAVMEVDIARKLNIPVVSVMLMIKTTVFSNS